MLLAVAPHGALLKPVHTQPAGCSSPWAETAFEYTALYTREERSGGPQRPSPTAFEKIHDASPDPLSGDLLSIHIGFSVTASGGRQPAAASTPLPPESGAPDLCDLPGICTTKPGDAAPVTRAPIMSTPGFSPLRHGCIPYL